MKLVREKLSDPGTSELQWQEIWDDETYPTCFGN